MEKIAFKLYLKYIKGVLNVHGIELIPTLHESELYINFKIRNPKNVPYTKMCLNGFVAESIFNFKQVTGLSVKWMENSGYDVDCEDLYVTKELYNDVDNKLKKIDTLKKQIGYDNLIIIVSHVKTKFSIVDRDMVKIENFVIPLDAYYKNIESGEEYFVSNESAVEDYTQENYKHRFSDSEDNYLSIDNVLDKYPTLVDKEWQVNYTITEFMEL